MKRNLDILLGLVLFGGALSYLYYWPRDLYAFDEGLYLYEAKRILSGEVMYRDFFEMVTPLSFYGMALLFGIFGVTMETARVSMAIMHALIAVMIFLVCRVMHVRRGLAAAAAAAHVVMFYPALTIASPHWCSTFLTLALLYLLVQRKATGAARAAGIGLGVGLLIWTQQQKGWAIALGVGLVMILDVSTEAHTGRKRWRRLAETLTAYASGVLGISFPIVVALLLWAGFEPTYAALILFPLRNYRPYVENITWGMSAVWLVHFPRLMPVLPYIVPLALARAAWQWVAADRREESRPLRVAAIMAAFALLSVVYNPDYTHLAIVGPTWIVLVAEALDAGLSWAERRARVIRLVASAAVLLLSLFLGWHAARNMELQHARYPVAYNTAFGRIHFHAPDEFLLVRQLARLSAETPTREIFAYPCAASLYLLTNSTNATRFQLMLPNYNPRDHFEEALTALEERQVPFIARSFCFVGPADDPLYPYLRMNYDQLKRPFRNRNVSPFVIYRRKSGSGETAEPK